MTHSTIVQNQALAGFGGNGGFGGIGGLAGGNGGDGGDAYGGGIYSGYSYTAHPHFAVTVIATTIARNGIRAANGGFGGSPGNLAKELNADPVPSRYQAAPGQTIWIGSNAVLSGHGGFAALGGGGLAADPDVSFTSGTTLTDLGASSQKVSQMALVASQAAAYTSMAPIIGAGFGVGAALASTLVPLSTTVAGEGGLAATSAIGSAILGTTLVQYPITSAALATGGVAGGAAVLAIGVAVAVKGITYGAITGDWAHAVSFALGTPGKIHPIRLCGPAHRRQPVGR